MIRRRHARLVLLGALGLAIALLAASGAMAAAAVDSNVGFAPTADEIAATAKRLAADAARAGRPDASQPRPLDTGTRLAPTTTRPALAGDDQGFPWQATLVGAAIGLGIGLVLAALVLLAGRRRGQAVSI